MPDLATLLLFTATAVVLVAIPGPNLIYITTRSISEGRRAGLASALGVETGTIIHVGAAAVGLSALLASSAVAFSVIKYAGAAYLIYLGVRALLTAGHRLESDSTWTSRSLPRAYRQGLLVQVLNPKVAIFFLALLPQFVDPANGSAATQILVLGGLLAVLGFVIDCLYALAAGAISSWLRARPRAVRRQQYLTGGVYITLGVAAALSGERRAT